MMPVKINQLWMMQELRALVLPDTSYIVMSYWFEPVLYLDLVAKFPETTERPRYIVNFWKMLEMN